jgi:hypothetical protein
MNKPEPLFDVPVLVMVGCRAILRWLNRFYRSQHSDPHAIGREYQ